MIIPLAAIVGHLLRPKFCTRSSFHLDMHNLDIHNEDMQALRYHHASKTIELKRLSLITDQKCADCYMHAKHCVCKRVVEIFSEESEKIQSHVSIFMHFREFTKASNTGKLMKIGLRDKCSMHLYGSKDDEEALVNSLRETPSLILYPSPDAQPIEQFRDWFQSCQQRQLCVVDATWGLSKSAAKALPADIPRVHISNIISNPSLFLSRKQTTPTRVSTIEAVAIALECLGESSAAVSPFYEALRVNVDRVNMQRGRPAFYGNDEDFV